MSDETVRPFRLPAAIADSIDTTLYGNCSNCHGVEKTGELIGGLCGDCLPTPEPAPAETDLDVFGPAPEPELSLDVAGSTSDELADRRERRDRVRKALDPSPASWIEHAVRAVQEECVSGRTGHVFTEDEINDRIERMAPGAEPTVHLNAALRFVMQTAVERGWCEPTDRKQPSRREDGGKIRQYRTTL